MVGPLTRSRLRAAVAPTVAGALLLPATAPAAFPGKAGPIVYHVDRSLYTISPAGGTPRKLPEDVAGFGGMSVSADGLRIAYAAGHQLWTVNVDGSAPRQVTPSGAPFSDNPSWSPDGTKLAYEREYGIWVMNADGSGAHTITPGAGFSNAASQPAWSPDGKQIAYTQQQQVWAMNADGSSPHVLTPAIGACPGTTRTMSGDAADWSPDGARLVFTGPVTCGNSRGTDLWTMAADGSAQADLIGDDATEDGAATFSPDGAMIAFTRDAGSGPRLETMPAAGGAPTEVADGGQAADGPVWAVAYVPPTISERATARGHRLTVSGAVKPAATGRVRVSVKRGARIVAQRTVKLKHSRFRIAVKAARPGAYRAVATLLADPTHEAVTSKARTARVRK